MKAAVDDLEGGQVVEALAEARCGTFLLDALDGAKLTPLLVRAATGGELLTAVTAMSLRLVAQDRDGQLVGALLAVPSATIAEMASRLPGDAPYDLVSMLKVRQDQGARGARGRPGSRDRGGAVETLRTDLLAAGLPHALR